MNITAAFDAAEEYDRHALVQRRVVSRLAEDIAGWRLAPDVRVLEIGCGTGLLGAALIDRMPQARWLMTDISPAMVQRAAARLAGNPRVAVQVMDGEWPRGPARFDLVCSSLAMQWFGDLAGSVARLRARLAAGGRLAFTTLIDGTFAEWRAAHRGLPVGIRDLPSAQALEAMGLAVTVEAYPECHADARQFLRSLKAIGAGTPRPGYRPLSPAALNDVMERFEASGATATYVVATCVATGPARQAR